MRIPQYLHKPPQVLFMEADEAGMIGLLFILAMILGYVFWILLFVLPYLYNRQKKFYPRGALRHWLYKLGVLKFEGVPIFFENRFKE